MVNGKRIFEVITYSWAAHLRFVSRDSQLFGPAFAERPSVIVWAGHVLLPLTLIWQHMFEQPKRSILKTLRV